MITSSVNKKTHISNQVVNAIRSVVGNESVSLHEPNFSGNEWEYIKECLDSNFVSSVGKFVDKFEDDLAVYTGAKYAVAIVNGTSALHIALLLAGVKMDDEVLVPTLTFVASANAISYCGATPQLVIVRKQHQQQLLSCATIYSSLLNKITASVSIVALGKLFAPWWSCIRLGIQVIWMVCLRLRVTLI